jgi:hypothetical protein
MWHGSFPRGLLLAAAVAASSWLWHCSLPSGLLLAAAAASSWLQRCAFSWLQRCASSSSGQRHDDSPRSLLCVAAAGTTFGLCRAALLFGYSAHSGAQSQQWGAFPVILRIPKRVDLIPAGQRGCRVRKLVLSVDRTLLA